MPTENVSDREKYLIVQSLIALEFMRPFLFERINGRDYLIHETYWQWLQGIDFHINDLKTWCKEQNINIPERRKSDAI